MVNTDEYNIDRKSESAEVAEHSVRAAGTHGIITDCHFRKTNSKLSYRWDSSRYDELSDSLAFDFWAL